jgi:hypothetical protein
MTILKIIAVLIWVFEVFLGAVKCMTGEFVHPVIFTLMALTCVIYSIRDADGGI